MKIRAFRENDSSFRQPQTCSFSISDSFSPAADGIIIFSGSFWQQHSSPPQQNLGRNRNINFCQSWVGGSAKLCSPQLVDVFFQARRKRFHLCHFLISKLTTRRPGEGVKSVCVAKQWRRNVCHSFPGTPGFERVWKETIAFSFLLWLFEMKLCLEIILMLTRATTTKGLTFGGTNFGMYTQQSWMPVSGIVAFGGKVSTGLTGASFAVYGWQFAYCSINPIMMLSLG